MLAAVGILAGEYVQGSSFLFDARISGREPGTSVVPFSSAPSDFLPFLSCPLFWDNPVKLSLFSSTQAAPVQVDKVELFQLNLSISQLELTNPFQLNFSTTFCWFQVSFQASGTKPV